MKLLAILGVLAACLALANAVAVDPLDSGVKILEDYAQSMSEKVEEVTHAIEHKYDEVIVQPQQRVETAISNIEERVEENEACVVQYEHELEVIVQELESSFDICTQTAYNSSSTVSIQIVTRSVEIGHDSYALVKGVQRCRRYSNIILKSTCYAKQLSRANNLIRKAKTAVDDLNDTVNETIPHILVNLERCVGDAEQSALAELENINHNIDACATLKKIKAKILN